MKYITPKVFLVGETKAIPEGLTQFFDHIGVPDWSTDAPTDSEKIIEVMGRVCYRSFAPGLNPNVTRVREGNDTYIANIIKSEHGSVTEHASVNFIFADVSRVFTHELVRHRVGTGMSQESLRYVRLEDLSFWTPSVIAENEAAMTIFSETVAYLEEQQKELGKLFGLDETSDFDFKKKVTSAMRRIAPDGLATSIGWTANFRTLRWVIEQRTSPHAEEEIRLVFGKVAEIAKERYPNLFADFTSETVDGLPWYKAGHRKI